jgi:hypothetical protein
MANLNPSDAKGLASWTITLPVIKADAHKTTNIRGKALSIIAAVLS